jgi:hypothetical protein
VAYAALVEAGRPDLAMSIAWFDEGEAGYLELLDEPADGDAALVEVAQALAIEALARGLVVR